MKLEPVFLVAPKPKPKVMPSRRAFLGMGLAFVCGGAVGSACGYSVGRARAADAAAGRDEEEIPKSGNADLDETRRLAVKAPIEELMAVAPVFLTVISMDYPDDEIAWRGIARIADRLERTPEEPSRRVLAKTAAAVIDGARSKMRAAHASWIPRLQAIK